MTNFRNLKIAINDQQPLDEVVEILESKGYWFNMDDGNNKLAKWVILVLPSGRYDIYNNDRHIGDWAKTTTLDELKEM
jgi:hypothetical protein